MDLHKISRCDKLEIQILIHKIEERFVVWAFGLFSAFELKLPHHIAAFAQTSNNMAQAKRKAAEVGENGTNKRYHGMPLCREVS